LDKQKKLISLALLFTGIIFALAVNHLVKDEKVDPIADHKETVWAGEFAFATQTPTITVAPEEGWWSEMPTEPAPLPEMPDIDLCSTPNSDGEEDNSDAWWNTTPTSLGPSTPTRTPLWTPKP